MNRSGGRGSHDYDGYTLDASEIETEIVDSVDEYFSSDRLKPTSDDENSLKGGDTLLMPIVRSRSASNTEAYQENDAVPIPMFDQQSTVTQKKMITSTQTPAANLILNLGDRIRTNFRSFVSRRENVYTTTESNLDIPLQMRNRRSSSNTDNFSSIPIGESGRMQSIPAKSNIDHFEVYDGTQPADFHFNERPAVVRSPSVGPSPSASKQHIRLRSTSEVRKNRMSMYEGK